MQNSFFVANCPFELGDYVKIILDKNRNILSDQTYIIDDIKSIHSLKNKTVEFLIIIVDYMGRELTARKTDDLKIIGYAKGSNNV